MPHLSWLDTVPSVLPSSETMADLAMAAVSLSFQLFSGCVQGYQLLSEAAALPREYQYVRVRIKTEQFRLLDWGSIAGLSESDSSLIVGRAGKAILLDVLEQQHELLYRFGRFDQKLRPLSKPLLTEIYSSTSESVQDDTDETDSPVRFPRCEELYNRAKSYVEATRKLPTRLRWAACDKKSIDAMLGKISALNDFLTEILSKDQAERLYELNTRTYYSIMQLNSSFGQLLNIIKAENATVVEEIAEFGMGNSTGEHKNHPMALPVPIPQDSLHKAVTASETESPNSVLGALAQVKALKAAIHEGCLTTVAAHDMGFGDSGQQSLLAEAELSKDSFLFLDGIPDYTVSLEDESTDAVYYQTKGRDKGTHVWIEWKRQTLANLGKPVCDSSACAMRDDTASKSFALRTERLAALVSLLRHDKNTRLFRAPRCLGYLREIVHIPDGRKGVKTYLYGLVFVKPSDCDRTARPVSLLELFAPMSETTHQPLPERRILPSLTKRAALARALVESVERLHAVNWLHKGLRSRNILFFAPAKALKSEMTNGVDLSQPMLSGFEYSRPALETLWTEKGSQNPSNDLYRHPEVQADGGRDFFCEQETTGMFKKIYDIYSLGIILLEIAIWKPVHVILAIDLEYAVLKDTMAVQRRLLQEEWVMSEVRFCMGDAMAEAITACLVGLQGLEPNTVEEDLEDESDLRLQREFYANVVLKVKSICI